MTQVQDIGAAIWYSFNQALLNFMSFLPAILGAIVVLVIGWILSSFLARLVERGLRAVGFERAATQAGISEFIRRANTKWTASKLTAELVKWFVRLIFIQAAADVLRMPQVTNVMNSIILFIPRIVVAVAIIVIGAVIANFLAGIVRGAVSEAGVANPDILARITRYAIIGFAVVAAINQLQIAQIVVNTLFIGLVGSVALALGLAFGFGGKEVAGEITRTWYESGKTATQRISKTVPAGAERKEAA